MATVKQASRPLEAFNVGTEDGLSVKDIGTAVGKIMGLTNLRFKFNGGLGDGRGWVGDVRSMLLDVTKLKSLGWLPTFKSRNAVEETVKSKLQSLGNGGLDSVQKTQKSNHGP